MVFVVSNTKQRLMPVSPYKARKLLKSGRARIFKHQPFTIMILDRESGDVQPAEYKSDVGYLHVGISVCSEKHEYKSIQIDMLADETERHNDQRKYRRTRRTRKRYRKPRFSNRRKPEGWMAPSIKHRAENQVRLYRRILEVCRSHRQPSRWANSIPSC